MEQIDPDFIDEFGEPGINFSTEECRKNIFFRFIHFMEGKFQQHGENVATYPKTYIFLILVSVCGTMFGFFCFRQERNPLNLWVPQDSDFFRDTHWLMQEFGEGARPQFILITAPDVLQPHVMTQLLNIHSKLINASQTSSSWQDVCLKVPIISFNVEGSRLRRHVKELSPKISDDIGSNLNQASHQGNASRIGTHLSVVVSTVLASVQQMMVEEIFDPSFIFGSFLYCGIVKNMDSGCYLESLLDLWKFDPHRIKNLTNTQIINDANTIEWSPTLGHQIPYQTLLGGVTYDSTGRIISAEALLSMYLVHVNFSSVNMDEAGNEGGTADWANGPGLEWESKFLEIMNEATETATGLEIYYEAGRSFGDISAAGMFQDVDKLMIGIALMLLYIQAQQTRISFVQSRMIPSMVGLLSVGLAFLAAIGLCSSFQIPYGPVHTSLPFLLLGIGVDDMFVIYSCWDTLPLKDKVSGVPKRMGQAMKHAGLSVTITSVTDAVAFFIGSSTILPSLRSFCLYAAIGVIVTFVLQTTLFIAVLALDQERLEEGRNCLLPCVHHEQPKHLKDEKTAVCSVGLNFIYSKFVITPIGKVLVIFSTLTFISLAAFGNSGLKQEFRPEWFLDQRSHLYKFMEVGSRYFPNMGYSAGIYLGKLHYSEEWQKIGNLVHGLENQTDIVTNVGAWWDGFRRYVVHHYKKDMQTQSLSDEVFNQYISRYLFSPSGARFQRNFKFEKPLECGKSASNITVAVIDFHFIKHDIPAQNIYRMNVLKTLVKNANLTSGDGFATVWGKMFANWVTDEVIAYELLRNIILALIAVVVTTFIFIGSALSSCWVLLSVCLTLFTTTGFMYFWGLTIDLVSSIALVLAVGLCVDFASHIAYAFMSSDGTLDERAVHAVSYIGGAVLHGGATTLLALSVLMFSHSYIFTAFFKIFLLIILFGVFYGLVFLPVVLSLLGPKPYSSCSVQDVGNDAPDQGSTLELRPSPEGRGL